MPTGSRKRAPNVRSALVALLALATLLQGFGAAQPAQAQGTGAGDGPTDPALLDPEEAMEEAREAFRRGRRAFARERFSEALAAFRRAHRLTASPDLLFHIGASADRLGFLEEALAAYREFVRLRPSAPERATAEERITVLEAAIRDRAVDPDGDPATPDPPDAASPPDGLGDADPDPEDGVSPDLRVPPPSDGEPDGGALEKGDRSDGSPGAGPYVLIGVGAAAVVGGTVALVVSTEDGSSDALGPVGGALIGVGAAAVVGGILWAVLGRGDGADAGTAQVDGDAGDGETLAGGLEVEVLPTPTGVLVTGRF